MQSQFGLFSSGTSFVFQISKYSFWLFSGFQDPCFVLFQLHVYISWDILHLPHLNILYILDVCVNILQCSFCLYFWGVYFVSMLIQFSCFPSCLFQIWHLFLCFSHLLDCLLPHCVAPLSLDLFITSSKSWCSESCVCCFTVHICLYIPIVVVDFFFFLLKYQIYFQLCLRQ